MMGQGMRKIVSQHLQFKKKLLKLLVTSLALKKTSKQKYAKLILVWVIGWLSRMFNVLGQPLHN